MTEVDPRQQALQYIAQALSDYADTLKPSVKGPFIREADAALKALTDPPKAQAQESYHG